MNTQTHAHIVTQGTPGPFYPLPDQSLGKVTKSSEWEDIHSVTFPTSRARTRVLADWNEIVLTCG